MDIVRIGFIVLRAFLCRGGSFRRVLGRRGTDHKVKGVFHLGGDLVVLKMLMTMVPGVVMNLLEEAG